MKRADKKRERVIKALSHQEPDRVPIGEFFWSSFLNRWHERYSLSEETDPYRWFDLDYIVINPNMDPHIKNFEIIERTSEHVVVKTGWECTVRKKFDDPMPAYLDFSVNTKEDMEKFKFDAPYDPRRYYTRGDDMINGVGDSFIQNLPSFVDRVNSYKNDFCVFGSVCDPHESLWRIIGSVEALYKLALEPEAVKDFNARIAEFMIGVGKAQVKAADGVLSGLYIWGDVAYAKGMLFSPKTWEKLYYPYVKRMCEEFHEIGMKVIYHGCGDARAIMDMLIDAGIDGYNPLEAKVGLDVVELKRKYGKRLTLVGNIDVRILANGSRQDIKKEVLRKLNAAEGGGYIFQSDHSVPGNVPPQSYHYAIELVKKFGRYPLNLGQFEEKV
jgi:uroporphyrinogen decarboxylase